MSRIYFAHSMNDYDSDYEQECLVKISESYPNWNIKNPNDFKLIGDPKLNGFFPYMEENFYKVINNCDILIYARDHRKGTISRGVQLEIVHANKVGLIVCNIDDL